MVVGLQDKEGMNQYINNFNESSPRTQSEKLTDYIANELHQKNINPARIYSMADVRRNEQVKFSAILEAMHKMLPNLTEDLMEQIPIAFNMHHSDVLGKAEFEMLFNPQAQ